MRLRPGSLLPLAILLPGLLVAGAMMYAAWEHNPMGEIHGPDGVRWGAWLAAGLAWLAPSAAAVLLAMLLPRLRR